MYQPVNALESIGKTAVSSKLNSVLLLLGVGLFTVIEARSFARKARHLANYFSRCNVLISKRIFYVKLWKILVQRVINRSYCSSFKQFVNQKHWKYLGDTTDTIHRVAVGFRVVSRIGKFTTKITAPEKRLSVKDVRRNCRK